MLTENRNKEPGPRLRRMHMSQSRIRTSMHVKKAKPNSHPPVVVLPYSGEDLMYKPLRKSFLDTKIIMDSGGK